MALRLGVNGQDKAAGSQVGPSVYNFGLIQKSSPSTIHCRFNSMALPTQTGGPGVDAGAGVGETGHPMHLGERQTVGDR